jgi:hypothetical protein
VPFDIIFDAHLKDLSKYRVLVLADQECLSDEQIGLIRDFVHLGGGLVATEHSSLYTDWRQRRRDFGLKDVFNVGAPERRSSGDPEKPLIVAPVRNRVGRGRASYISSVKPAVAKPAAAAMTSQYWKLPQNWQEIVTEVKWAAGGEFAMEAKAPLNVAAELTEQKDQGRWLVHLLNYDAERNPNVPPIEVSLRLPPGKMVARVSIVSPDREGIISPQIRATEGRAIFVVPALQTYSVAVVQLR